MAPITATTTIRLTTQSSVGGLPSVSNAVTARDPAAASVAAGSPLIATSSFGACRPSSPIVPPIVPNRSASSAGGRSAMSSARAGDTNVSPASGSLVRPGGTGAPLPSAATSIRASGRPST